MTNPNIIYFIFLIFTGTAILATAALLTRQSLMVAYIVIGALLGPWGLKLINNAAGIEQAGNIGIIFLLFLIGLDLQPKNLLRSIRKSSSVVFISSLIFFTAGYLFSYAFGYALHDCTIIGLACMFSSTIIGIKLLPTTILHHQHMGELVVSILLLQDILAIAIIMALQISSDKSGHLHHLILISSALPILMAVAYLAQRYVLNPLLKRFDKIHEYVFILSIGWCLFMAELSHVLSLSEEIGAFIAGVALASNPISSYIVENLKPVRDFFLVLFFFTIGATFNLSMFHLIFAPACLLASLLLVVKPFTFKWLLKRNHETKAMSWEIGIRLGQLSEFSLLLIFIGIQTNTLSSTAANMIQAAIIITFIVSCYWTILHYPTPMAITDKLRRD